MSDSKTLAELSGESGIPARTIRFYIARGLLEGPVKAGRGAVYTAQHLARIEKIKSLQAEGRMLAEIVRILNGAESTGTGPAPSAWYQHVTGTFQVRLAGEPMALGQSGTMIGYVVGGEVRWFGLANGAEAQRKLKARGKSVYVGFEGRDADGAVWKFQQQFSPGPISGAINITTEVTVDQDRSVAFLPMLMVFPGVGAFGAAKGQGLFAGLEYLDDEPSS